MTFDRNHIHIIGSYRQGQHILMTSKSQDLIQGHDGYFRFSRFFTRYREYPTVLIGQTFRLVCWASLTMLRYYQRWLNVVCPTFLDVFVFHHSPGGQ